MNVYFEHSDSSETLIGSGDNERECMKIINDFLDDKKYKSYYTRMWEINRGMKVDVGSHSEFFIIEGLSINKLK